MGTIKKSENTGGFLVADRQVTADGVHHWSFGPELLIDVVQHRLSADRPFRMNHHDYFELAYVDSGELVWQIQERFVTEKKGDLFVMGSLKYHRMTENSGPQVSATSLFFLPELIRSSSVAGDHEGYLMPFLLQNRDFPHVISGKTGVPSQVRDLMLKIKGELPAVSDRARLCIKTYLKMILVLLLNYYEPYLAEARTFDSRRKALDRLKPLFELLERKYGGSISLSDAASTVGMSSSYFRRSFKEVTGQSFVAYLNNFRIAKAQELLFSTEKSIAEISLEVGFCDQSYLGLVFRRCTGMSPVHYRRQVTRAMGGGIPTVALQTRISN